MTTSRELPSRAYRLRPAAHLRWGGLLLLWVLSCGGSSTGDPGGTGSCTDGRQNGQETGVDCGGLDCTACLDPSCSDGVDGPTEIDVDCGGICGPCQLGQFCGSDSDCVTSSCSDITATCVAPGCADGVQNGQETWWDCGGPDCPPCMIGGTCKVHSDCKSQVCAVNLGGFLSCSGGTCDDGIKSSSESDVDCGGLNCPPCGLCQGCKVDSDCVTGYCPASDRCEEIGGGAGAGGMFCP